MWYLLHLRVSKSSSKLDCNVHNTIYLCTQFTFVSTNILNKAKSAIFILATCLVSHTLPKICFPKNTRIQVARNVLKLYNGSLQFTPLTALLLRENVYVYHSRRSVYFISHKRVLKKKRVLQVWFRAYMFKQNAIKKKSWYCWVCFYDHQ